MDARSKRWGVVVDERVVWHQKEGAEKQFVFVDEQRNNAVFWCNCATPLQTREKKQRRDDKRGSGNVT